MLILFLLLEENGVGVKLVELMYSIMNRLICSEDPPTTMGRVQFIVIYKELKIPVKRDIIIGKI